MNKDANMKKAYVIGIACTLILALCESLFGSHFALFSINKAGGIEIKDEQYVFEKNKEDGSLWYRIEINYPQLLNPSKSDRIDRINMLLKNTAFSHFGSTYDEVIMYFKELEESETYRASRVSKYDILHLSNNYISLIYETEGVSGRVSTYHYFVTIDMDKGEYVGLNDLTNRDQLIHLIESGDFEVIEGTYSELHGDYFHQPEVIVFFVEILKSELANRKLSDGYDDISQNIGMDGENLYLHFYYDVSLNGYVLLRVPWNWNEQ